MTARPWLAVPLAALLWAAACAPADPEIVAIEYLRAVNGGDPDTAVQLVDVDEVVRQVEEEIIVIQQGSDEFLRDSVETVLWGLFRQSPQVEYVYQAEPAEIRGDRATVRVTKIKVEGKRSQTVVHLRRTAAGWRVSGESVQPLAAYVVQRLEERY